MHLKTEAVSIKLLSLFNTKAYETYLAIYTTKS